MTGPRPEVPRAHGANGDRAAVTWLFVPGSAPQRFEKARASTADAVICDLEDAVAPGDKAAALGHVADWLSGPGEAWVRLNVLSGPRHEEELAALADCRGLRGVVVPKAEDPEALAAASRRLHDVPVVALVESALGLHRVHDLAACPAVQQLAFGSIDFAEDVGARDSWETLLLARSTLVLASRVAGVLPPLDGVTTALRDEEVLRRDAERARDLGFGGKLCIHPAQLPTVARTFAPDAAQLEWARAVLAAETEGAGAVDGHMVDEPVRLRARRLLAAAADEP